MSDRTIKVLENGRYVVRGVHENASGKFYATQTRNDKLTYTIDFAPWLDSDTISSVTLTTSGPTVTSANTTTTVTLTASNVKGDGYTTVKITTAAALEKDLTLRFRETGVGYVDDYGS